MDTSQYLSMFLEESMDNLQTLNESLLDLEQKPDDIDKLNEIFRVAHTIKGMAATMGFSDIAELTHKMEDVLSKFREGELKVTQNVVTVLFDCLDTLERMVNNISEGIEEKVDIEKIMKDLHDISSNEQEAAPSVVEEVAVQNTDSSNYIIDINEYDVNVIKQAHEKGYKAIRVFIALSENTLLKSARAFLIFKELEEHGEVIKSYPSTEDIENENFDFTIELIVITTLETSEIEKIVENISEVDKVSVEEVELKIDKVNEVAVTKEEVNTVKVDETSNTVAPKPIVTNKPKAEEKKSGNAAPQKKVHQSVRVDLERLDKLMNMVSELVIHRTRLEQISTSYRAPELNETLEQVARTTSDLQDLVMKIRMLPLEVVFNRFPRMIRDLSVELNKDINFIVEGQDTELDRTVIDEIGEPLIHLLRNAADHGIENKEDRAKSGKDLMGTVKLSAYQEGTKAVIRVEDDGAGIDVEKVRRKAEKIGINTEGMTENDIKNLIFSQGFSTNEVVTDISGRGVGMDVVKTKISALGGTVDVVSEIGKGSSFIIRLPLTLQIIQALLVKVGEETLAISLGFIDRVIDYKEENIKKTNGREVIVYRDNVIPLIRLNETLQIDTSKKDKNFIIIVKVGDKVVGLLVDSLLGQQEIVIKPLGKTLEGLKEYIGATILGNGLVTLILDVGALI
ncbi:chemotaxis protein CheA [Clostridium manihotivorum]|jgi:two-component system chemotaxis sensor kinase CheA|uniref:Chemotaxis protein CheA n=1 Tax=Clostridium manihotivorum TaxID=2320868 RepID=A0A410DRH7_9CLOT|nr:chemotaxis protein CheA [Clostridium manihotivorum]QAA31632.1 chemotaxis protein CheA [Clostridium manihotivorum]